MSLLRGRAKHILGVFVATLVFSVFGLLGFGGVALAHGVQLSQNRGEAVELEAAFDSGEVMDDAQVTVYSPENPSEPWATGTTDAEGRYVFMPDAAEPGTWTVQVRKAGHGASTSVEVAEDGQATGVASDSGGASQMRMGLMGIAGLWGFVGTALFFKSRRG